MTASEARRHDLYHGLEEVLGPDRADTLMAYLPVNEVATLATKDDLAGLQEFQTPSVLAQWPVLATMHAGVAKR